MTNGGLLTTRSNRSSRDGFEHRPLAKIELDPGERRVEPRERERPPRDVGADHPARVPRRVQRLDPAARAEVEHEVPLVAHGDLRERRGRTADAQHVVGPQRLTGGQLAEVGGDPPVDLPAPVDGRVRAQVHAGTHLVAVGLDQAEPLGAADGQRRERTVEQPPVRGDAEQERADQRRDDVVGRRLRRPQSRQRLLAVQRVGGDRPQHLLDPGDAVAGSRSGRRAAPRRARGSVRGAPGARS